MSRTTALGVIPGKRPIELAEFRNAHGWGPSIWSRLMTHHCLGDWPSNDLGLRRLCASIESLPEWQQAALVLTFDTGVIPFPSFGWAAQQMEEFDRRLPSREGHVNHVPAMAELLRTCPEVPLFGVWGTSVTDNLFDPWDDESDAPGSGIPFSGMYVLERHRRLLPTGQIASRQGS